MIHNQNLQNVDPFTWNNIPIPVIEAFSDVINQILSQQSLQSHLESNVMETLRILETMIQYIDATGEDVRGQVSERFTMLNQKAEKEVIKCSDKLKELIDIQCKKNQMICRNDTQNMMNKAMRDIEDMLRVHKLEMIKIVRKESAENVLKGIKDELSIPGLIGEREKYATFQHCLVDMETAFNNGM